MSFILEKRRGLQGWTKRSGYPIKYSKFGITITGRTKIKGKPYVYLECFLRDH